MASKRQSLLIEFLVKWLKNVRSQNVPVTEMLVKVFQLEFLCYFTHISKKRAKEITEYQKVLDFNMSDGWLTCFRTVLQIR